MGIHTASAQHVSGALKKQYQALLLNWDAHKEGAAAPPVAKEGAPLPAKVAAADGAPAAGLSTLQTQLATFTRGASMFG